MFRLTPFGTQDATREISSLRFGFMATVAAAKSAFAEGRYADACNRFSALLNNDPDNVAYLMNRSATFLKLERFDEAVQDAECAVILAPMGDSRCYKANYRLACALHSNGEYERARVVVDRLVEMQPLTSQVGALRQQLELSMRAARPKEAGHAVRVMSRRLAADGTRKPLITPTPQSAQPSPAAEASPPADASSSSSSSSSSAEPPPRATLYHSVPLAASSHPGVGGCCGWRRALLWVTAPLLAVARGAVESVRSGVRSMSLGSIWPWRKLIGHSPRGVEQTGGSDTPHTDDEGAPPVPSPPSLPSLPSPPVPPPPVVVQTGLAALPSELIASCLGGLCLTDLLHSRSACRVFAEECRELLLERPKLMPSTYVFTATWQGAHPDSIWPEEDQVTMTAAGTLTLQADGRVRGSVDEAAAVRAGSSVGGGGSNSSSGGGARCSFEDLSSRSRRGASSALSGYWGTVFHHRHQHLEEEEARRGGSGGGAESGGGGGGGAAVEASSGRHVSSLPVAAAEAAANGDYSQLAEAIVAEPTVRLSWEGLTLALKLHHTHVSAAEQRWELAGTWRQARRPGRGEDGAGGVGHSTGPVRMEWHLLYGEE